jgi:uncharacterized protein
MKFQPDTLDGVNVLSRHEAGRVWVNGVAWQRSLAVPARGTVAEWGAARFEDLRAEHFDALAAGGPEVVIFGSGSRLRFPPPALLRGLIARRIGVETMDLAAACRTYNVLAAEGRAVVAALLLESGPV